jgi:hypothetical protein
MTDLMTAQPLQEWLKAAPDQTAQDGIFDFHCAHARRSRNLLDGRVTHESHLHSLYRSSLVMLASLGGRLIAEIPRIRDSVCHAGPRVA